MSKSFKHLLPGHRRAGKNSGILSNSGAGQRAKGIPTPSEGKKAKLGILAYALKNHHRIKGGN